MTFGVKPAGAAPADGAPKVEENKAAGLAGPVDPAQKVQAEAAARDQAFLNTPLQEVTKKWQQQIRTNET